MNRRLGSLLALILLASPAQAQGVGPLVKYGKWALAAGALGMNLLAAKAHNRAEDNFDALEQRCFSNERACDLNVSGRYSDASSELFYQESLRYDRQARRLLFGGETALLGAAAMFVWELTRKTHRPDIVPFKPEVRKLREATGVGISVGF
ncbi:MAG TPA: hypothetical protein VHR41_18180 [Gemmatimonadales bacterium]|jgi:hypothetical protein|nr:hypothetical protein [Gemmatimonadales bacterium]